MKRLGSIRAHLEKEVGYIYQQEDDSSSARDSLQPLVRVLIEHFKAKLGPGRVHSLYHVSNGRRIRTAIDVTSVGLGAVVRSGNDESCPGSQPDARETPLGTGSERWFGGQLRR